MVSDSSECGVGVLVFAKGTGGGNPPVDVMVAGGVLFFVTFSGSGSFLRGLSSELSFESLDS